MNIFTHNKHPNAWIHTFFLKYIFDGGNFNEVIKQEWTTKYKKFYS